MIARLSPSTFRFAIISFDGWAFGCPERPGEPFEAAGEGAKHGALQLRFRVVGKLIGGKLLDVAARALAGGLPIEVVEAAFVVGEINYQRLVFELEHLDDVEGDRPEGLQILDALGRRSVTIVHRQIPLDQRVTCRARRAASRSIARDLGAGNLAAAEMRA